VLDTAIGKSNRVGSLSVTGTITSLSSIEVGVGVVISNSIGVGVRGGLIGIGNGSLHNWGMVSRGSMNNRGSMDNRGMVGRGSMDNGGSMDNWSMVSRGSMNNGSSMDNRGMVGGTMSKDSLGSVKTVRRVSNSGNTSTESLGLCGASVFSLVWLRD